jgi:hypothetical protein
MMKSTLILLASMSAVSGFAFVPASSSNSIPMTSAGQMTSSKITVSRSPNTSQRLTSSSLCMVEQNVIMGAGIAAAGLVAGIGLVAFTENQGERSKERGSGLSEGMSTRIAGQLMEDVEVSSVSDLGSLTSQLEQALKESGGADGAQFEMTEEEKKRIEEEADDGW